MRDAKVEVLGLGIGNRCKRDDPTEGELVFLHGGERLGSSLRSQLLGES